MKRSKEEEKRMGPMFPRLHVNDIDAEKGGPKAPPRNKMALYEQLSIPSQRFNLIPPGSSSQASVPQRNMQLPLHYPASASTHPAERLTYPLSAGGGNLHSRGGLEQRKKVGEEDDFRVPVFVQSEMNKNYGRTPTMQTLFSHHYSGQSMQFQNIYVNDPNQISSSGVNFNAGSQTREIPKVHVSGEDHSLRSHTNLSTGEKSVRVCKEVDVALDQKSQVCGERKLGSRLISRGHDGGHSGMVSELIRTVETGDSHPSRNEFLSREDCISPIECEIYSQSQENKTCGLQQGEKSDDVSEASSISAIHISPDDVMEVLGHKHFLNARKAIVNQQRVFAVQVFELHRLIKVQRLISGSPDLLLDGAFVDKTFAVDSPVKKPPSEYVVISPVQIAKQKDESKKQNNKIECSAENAVGKTSVSSIKDGSHPSPYGSYLENCMPVPVSVDADTKMGPWCYPLSVGQQWLIPVMSPSEGLIYKPYAAPGYMTSACGGCGPGIHAMKPSHTVHMLPHHNHQGIGFLQGGAPLVHGYCPPYGMPMTNPPISGSVIKQMQLCGTRSQGQTGRLSEGRGDVQNQSSCNMPTEKGGACGGPQVMRPQIHRDTDFGESTASNPTERVQGAGTAKVAEASDVHSFLPIAFDAPEGARLLLKQDAPTRVIRVVPHNPRSATESAARIFQSIQEQRKH